MAITANDFFSGMICLAAKPESFRKKIISSLVKALRVVISANSENFPSSSIMYFASQSQDHPDRRFLLSLLNFS